VKILTEINYDRMTMEPIVTVFHEPEMDDLVMPETELKLPGQDVASVFVSIIVLCWNNIEYTKTCIESIKEMTKREMYQFVVVDNGSTDGTFVYLLSALDSEKHVIVRNPVNRGFSAGNNQGLKVAEGEYVLLLNNDCKVFGANWLDMLIKASENAALVGASCGKVRADYQNRRFVHVGQGRETDQWSYLEGWCLFGRRRLFQELNGFDMRFNPAYSEDADLSFRVKKMGLKIKAVRLPLRHFGNKSLGQLREEYSDQPAKSDRLLFEKWLGETAKKDADKSKVVEESARKPKILVKRRGAKGDVLMLTPILRELKARHPLSFITVQTECVDVLEGNPNVDRLEKFTSGSRGSFDFAFAPRYESDPTANAIDVMAKQCGVALKDRRMKIVLSESDLLWARMQASNPFSIAVHTGRSWRSREWPIDRFREVFEHFTKKGFDILELGDRNTICTGIGRDVRGCSVKQTAAVIDQSMIFLGIDSLCANLAKAVGTPACIIYGCVDPKSRIADANEFPIWVEDLDCKGCRNRTSAEHVDCSKPEIYCVTRVTVSMVIELMERVIQEINSQ